MRPLEPLDEQQSRMFVTEMSQKLNTHGNTAMIRLPLVRAKSNDLMRAERYCLAPATLRNGI